MSPESRTTPSWLSELLKAGPAGEGETLELRGEPYVVRNGVIRQGQTASDAQSHTSEAFGFKWAKRDTFESEHSLQRMKAWLQDRYGDVSKAEWWSDYDAPALLLDAGCGAGMSGLLLFEPLLGDLRYLGADISAAVDVAVERFAERGLDGGFIQADITRLPIPEASVDVIFSEGVLHHTDSTEGALKALAPLLRPDGRFLFYVYRRKSPIREFSDDYIREALSTMEPEAAWQALIPLTKLGQALGEMQVTVDVPEEIGLLEIPGGEIDLQRLFYWHIFKAYHDPGMTLEELNHINYDWYAPRNAHRQTPEEVRRWCDEAGLVVEREQVEEAGITIIARKVS